MYVCFSFLKESLTFVGNTKLVSLAIINKTKYTNERRTRQPVCPLQFARCFNDQCPQASKCLRHIAAQNNGADYLYITNVNPARYPADGNQCECFKTAVKVHVTWGLKRLLDRIPYEDAVSIRSQLVGHYGKTGYYRLYRGERGLMPKDQAYIKQLFRNKGIKEEPTYQRYTEEYIW